MAVERLDNVGIVVDDLDAAIAFFIELGLEVEGRSPIEGQFADDATGLPGTRSEIAMMRTPDGHGRLELTKYFAPAALPAVPANAPPNILGMHRVMFAVGDLDDTLARLRPHGAEPLGSVAQYENVYRLCYVRGPAGIIVGLAEEIG
jgi:catechol 2,3-dioxygenase-like lactoylglutathione lyase family enzyme